MPTYTAKCDKCGKVIDYMRAMMRRDITPVCCQQNMTRLKDAPKGFVDTPAAK